MKIIKGGIPARPIGGQGQGPGEVYHELSVMQIDLALQTLKTEDMVVAKLLPVEGNADWYLEKYYQDVYLPHINSKGRVHGETIQNIGLPLINDYRNANSDDIVKGESWDSYVTPRELNLALKKWTHGFDPTIVHNGLRGLTKGWLDTLHGFDPYAEPTPVKKASYERLGVTFYKDGALVLTNDNRTLAVRTSTLNASYIHRLTTIGVSSSKRHCVGWNTNSFYSDPSNAHRRFNIMDDLVKDRLFMLSAGVPKTQNPIASKVTWLLPYPSYRFGVGCYLSATSAGIGMGFCKEQFTGSDDMFGQNIPSFTVNYSAVALTGNETLITWDHLFPGKTIVVKESLTHGGVEWKKPGVSLFLFLSVSITVDGIPKTVYLGWDGVFTKEHELQINPRFTTTTLGEENNFLLPELEESHSFNPNWGYGVFKPNGGHVTASMTRGILSVVEHHHDINSLEQFFTKRAEIHELNPKTLVKVTRPSIYSTFGDSYNRVFVVGNETYPTPSKFLVGINDANGEYRYYLNTVNLGTNTIPSTGILETFPVEETVLLGYGHLLREEMVNLSSDNIGESHLNSLIWSSRNNYTAYDRIGFANNRVSGTEVYLTPEDLSWLKYQHSDYSVNMGEDKDPYSLLICFGDSNLDGFFIQTDRLGEIRIKNVRFSRTGNVFRITHQGGEKVFNLTMSVPKERAVNLGNYLPTDVYVNKTHVHIRNLFGDGDNLVTFEREFSPGSKDSISVNTFDKELGNIKDRGVGCYLSPIPLGGNYPAPFVFSGSNDETPTHYYYLNGTKRIYNPFDLEEVMELNGQYIVNVNHNLNLMINGTRYDVPPGLCFKCPKDTTSFLYLGLTERGLSPVVLVFYPDDQSNLVYYGEMDSDGNFERGIE